MPANAPVRPRLGHALTAQAELAPRYLVVTLWPRRNGVVFILWGGFAQKKGKVINRSRHCVIEAAHPSPLSVTKFRGCKVFG